MHADVQAQRAREFARAAPVGAEQPLERPRRERPQQQHQRQRDGREPPHHAAHGRAAFASDSRDAQGRAGVRGVIGGRTLRRQLRIERLRHRAAHQRGRCLQVAQRQPPEAGGNRALPGGDHADRDGVLQRAHEGMRRVEHREVAKAPREFAPAAWRRPGVVVARHAQHRRRRGRSRDRRGDQALRAGAQQGRASLRQRRATVLHDARDRQCAVGLGARGPQGGQRQPAQHADGQRQPEGPAIARHREPDRRRQRARERHAREHAQAQRAQRRRVGAVAHQRQRELIARARHHREVGRDGSEQVIDAELLRRVQPREPGAQQQRQRLRDGAAGDQGQHGAQQAASRGRRQGHCARGPTAAASASTTRSRSASDRSALIGRLITSSAAARLSGQLSGSPNFTYAGWRCSGFG